MSLSKLTEGVFNAWRKARQTNNNSKKLDLSFIRNMEKAHISEIKKMIYEVDNIDYEKIPYLSKSISKYRLLSILIEKFDRLERILINEIEKKNN